MCPVKQAEVNSSWCEHLLVDLIAKIRSVIVGQGDCLSTGGTLKANVDPLGETDDVVAMVAGSFHKFLSQFRQRLISDAICLAICRWSLSWSL